MNKPRSVFTLPDNVQGKIYSFFCFHLYSRNIFFLHPLKKVFANAFYIFRTLAEWLKKIGHDKFSRKKLRL